jgi:hypothetical protein
VIVVVVCLVLLAAGVLVAVRWGRVPLATPGPLWGRRGRPTAGAVLRRYLWWLTVCTVASLVSAVLAAGAGGRLAMRLLAQTSPEARGRVTEAGEVVGEVSVGGSVALLVFGALPAAVVATVLYLLVHRFLPAGWGRPTALAGLLLLFFSVRLEPLRPDNVDFAILGPAWLSVGTFVLLALLHAAVVVGVAGAYSRVLPEYGEGSHAWYAPLLVLPVLFPLGALAAVLGLVVVAGSRLLPARRPAVPGGVRTGRAVLAAAAAVALPGFALGVQDVLVR